MATREQKIQKLREYQAEAERAKGRAEVAVTNLKEAGYPSRKEASDALDKLNSDIKEREEEFEREYEAFEEEWTEKSQD